jgi:hypothetical protein
VRARGSFAARLGWVFVAALVLRMAYALTLAKHDNLYGPTGDRFFFTEAARLLAQGRGFIHPFVWVVGHHAAPSAGHPPLWSLVLAPFALVGLDGYESARVVGAAIGAATVPVVGLIARRMAGERAGLLAAGFAAIYPVFVSSDTSGMSEALYLLLVALALLAVLGARERPGVRSAALAGAATGFAALTRTEGLLLLPLLAWPALWRRPRPWLMPATATLAALLVLAPWTVRTWVALDRFVPVSTNEATVLAGANCADTYHGRDLGSWSVGCLSVEQPFRGLASYDEGQAYVAWRHAGWDYARRHADRWPLVVPVRILRTWNLWQPLRQARELEGQNRRVSEAATFVFLALLLPGGLLGAALGRLRRDHLLMLGALGAMVTISSAVGWGFPRFLRPAELALLVCAGAGADRALRARRLGSRPRLGAAAWACRAGSGWRRP